MGGLIAAFSVVVRVKGRGGTVIVAAAMDSADPRQRRRQASFGAKEDTSRAARMAASTLGGRSREVDQGCLEGSEAAWMGQGTTRRGRRRVEDEIDQSWSGDLRPAIVFATRL